MSSLPQGNPTINIVQTDEVNCKNQNSILRDSSFVVLKVPRVGPVLFRSDNMRRKMKEKSFASFENLQKLSYALYKKHDFEKALQAFLLLLPEVTAKYGENAVQVASILKRMGCCYFEVGFYAASIIARKEAIRIWGVNGAHNYKTEMQFTQARIDLVDREFCTAPYPDPATLSGTSVLLENNGLIKKQYKEAMKLYNKCSFVKALPSLNLLLGTLIARFGEKSVQAAFVLKQIACCQYETCNYKASVATRKEVLRIWKANYKTGNEKEITYTKARIAYTERYKLQGRV